MKKLFQPFKESAGSVRYRLKQILHVGNQHKLLPFGSTPFPQASHSQTLVSLDHITLPLPQTLRLVSFPYGYSSVSGYPSIETWSLSGSSSFCHDELYQRVQSDLIDKHIKDADPRHIYSPVAVFPHFTSQFGHFVGDFLGSLIWFSGYLQKSDPKRKLLICTPSPGWDRLILQLCGTDNLLLIRPEELLCSNILLHNAIMLPRLSAWQSLMLAKNSITSYLSDHGSDMPGSADVPHRCPDRIFLCSQRSSRVHDVTRICSIFQSVGYTIINPVDMLPGQLFGYLFRASEVWTENGSMVLNVLVSRCSQSNVFCLHPHYFAEYPDRTYFVGGGVYNEFGRGLLRPFYCEPADLRQSLINGSHPYQWCMRIDPDQLLSQIC